MWENLRTEIISWYGIIDGKTKKVQKKYEENTLRIMIISNENAKKKLRRR